MLPLASSHCRARSSISLAFARHSSAVRILNDIALSALHRAPNKKPRVLFVFAHKFLWAEPKLRVQEGMIDMLSKRTPADFQIRAAEVREIAQGIFDKTERRKVLQLVSDYEKLARKITRQEALKR
jgi:hypothetical protein